MAITAVIVLNHFYLKTIHQLKRTLAHEYGHHWTLSHLAIREGIDMKQRLPERYYRLRQLDPRKYAHDASVHWSRRDKEVIAEDYRGLFASAPHAQDHRMSAELPFPNLQVKEYIRNLAF